MVFCPDCGTALVGPDGVEPATDEVTCDWCGAAVQIEAGQATISDHGPHYWPLIEPEY